MNMCNIHYLDRIFAIRIILCLPSVLIWCHSLDICTSITQCVPPPNRHILFHAFCRHYPPMHVRIESTLNRKTYERLAYFIIYLFIICMKKIMFQLILHGLYEYCIQVVRLLIILFGFRIGVRNTYSWTTKHISCTSYVWVYFYRIAVLKMSLFSSVLLIFSSILYMTKYTQLSTHCDTNTGHVEICGLSILLFSVHLCATRKYWYSTSAKRQLNDVNLDVQYELYENLQQQHEVEFNRRHVCAPCMIVYSNQSEHQNILCTCWIEIVRKS